MPIFQRVLIINRCWILSKAFSASIEIIIRFLPFNFNICSHIDLCILKNPCIPGINPTWSWCMSFLMCCWILFAKILLRIFASLFHQWYWPVVFYICVIFAWFWYQGDGGLVELVWNCSFLCNLLKEF